MIETVAKALNQFWNGFGIPAYLENSVPDDAELPYITYTLTIPSWDNTTTHNAMIWYRANSIAPVAEKAEEIAKAIGSHKAIKCQNGGVVLFPGAGDFVQISNYDETNAIKMGYINLVMMALTD